MDASAQRLRAAKNPVPLHAVLAMLLIAASVINGAIVYARL